MEPPQPLTSFLMPPDLPYLPCGTVLAGKYVPSVAHYILSQAVSLTATRSLGRLAPTAANGAPRRPLQHRPMPAQLAATRPLLAQPPLFDLRGLAIGNGLTDPAAQVGVGGGGVHCRGIAALPLVSLTHAQVDVGGGGCIVEALPDSP